MRSEHPALTLEASAGLIGAYRWIEQRMFALVGSWVREVGPAEVRVHLDWASTEHGWHAELWHRRLPVLDHLDAEVLTRPAGPASEALLRAAETQLAELPPDPLAPAIARLTILHRVVLPRLLVTYGRHLERAAPVADGPVIKVLELVHRDELECCAAGEALLQRLLRGRAEAQLAHTVQGRLETVVVSSGVGAGLVPWPS